MAKGLLVSCLSVLSGIAVTLYADDNSLTIEITVDKVVYQPGAQGEAMVRVVSPLCDPGRVLVRSRLEHGLDQYFDLPHVFIDLAATNVVVIPFPVPDAAGGCAIQVEVIREDWSLAQTQDVFVVGNNPFRLGQQASTG